MIGRASRSTTVAAVGVLLGGLLLADRAAPVNAQAEPLAPYRIGFTRGADGAGGDLWSSDSAGGDPQRIAGTPLTEVHPAYSPDGTRIAFTRHEGDESPSRVVVAEADGSAARLLSGRGGESQPTWSPDGTKLAVATGTGLRVVDSDDGEVITDIPMPPHLDGQDFDPAWSPDGTTIAFARDTWEQRTPLVTPYTVGGSTGAGGGFDTTAALRTPGVPTRPEIVFLLDTTGSMGTTLDTVKRNLRTVLEQLSAAQPEATFGLATYQDIGDGDRRYQLHQNLTGDQAALLAELNELRIVPGEGGDAHEDWFNGLYRLASDEVFVREGTSRIIVTVGDEPSHERCEDPDCPGPYWRRSEVLGALLAKDVHVVGVPVATGGSGMDAAGQATDITTRTGGSLVPQDAPPQQITEAITAGIADLPVTVTPRTRCDDGLSVAFEPTSVTVRGAADVRFAERVTVGTARAATVLRCTISFLLNGEPAAVPYEQHISVALQDDALPTVVVNGGTARSPDRQPVPVRFTASATSAGGAPLRPSCDAVSGAPFPYGVTTVTCTADDAGRVGSAASVVIVHDEARERTSGIWLAAVDLTTAAVRTQTDLSARFGDDCAGYDSAPAWSPDGSRLAFTQDNTWLCVAEATGADATRVVGDLRPDNPEWLPDGSGILFEGGEYEVGGRRLWTVEPSGGEPREVVVLEGEDVGDPTVRRMVDLAVTGSAVPAEIAFGGTTTVRLLVVNKGFAASRTTDLAITPPAGLRAEAVSATRGTCDTATATCALGVLRPGERAEVRVPLTGVAAGEQVLRASLADDVNPGDNRVDVAVDVAEEVRPPENPGSLSMAVAAVPRQSYVGGDDVVLSFRMRNGAPRPMTDVRLVTSLPPALLAPSSVAAGCQADGSVCLIGALQPGQEAEVRIALPAKAAVTTSVGGSVLATGPDSDLADNTATAEISVRQPVLQVQPPVGPPGFVAGAEGRGFPPGATVRLPWTRGISQSPGEVVVEADGTFEAQVLVFPHDQLGVRALTGAPVHGPRFGEVRSNDFLVVPRTVQPPDFLFRG